MQDDLGAVYTTGPGFRARAEARQREYRAQVLHTGWSRYGHLLDEPAASAGANFVTPEVLAAVRERAAHGKGVDPRRTFGNMLSSQAMCFNIFTPLAKHADLALTVLRPFFPVPAGVRSITFEYTPLNDVFGDQSGRGGVDCDLLIEGTASDGEACIIAIETKFVEPEFSTCGFRRPGRKGKGQPVCLEQVRVRDDDAACLYTSARHYRYWERTREQRTLKLTALPEAGCPFGGAEWQLWVNHTLVHVEAARHGVRHAMFAVCAPVANDSLLGDGVLDRFRSRLERPESFGFLPLDVLLAHISATAEHEPALCLWSTALAARYGGI
jgi:hypothetical protein